MGLLEEKRAWEQRRRALKQKRGIHRHPIIGDTKLSPMHRFLSQADKMGYAVPTYHQQWQTLFKAEKLGYVAGYNKPLTRKGKAQLAKLHQGKR